VALIVVATADSFVIDAAAARELRITARNASQPWS